MNGLVGVRSLNVYRSVHGINGHYSLSMEIGSCVSEHAYQIMAAKAFKVCGMSGRPRILLKASRYVSCKSEIPIRRKLLRISCPELPFFGNFLSHQRICTRAIRFGVASIVPRSIWFETRQPLKITGCFLWDWLSENFTFRSL